MKGTVIVGASLGGLRVAEALRKNGYEGSIDILGDESHLPYDRPPLSKDVLTGARAPHDTVFRQPAELQDQGISVHIDAVVDGVDVEAGLVTAGSRDLAYDNLVIATGARPRQVSGAEHLEGVHTIRSLDDATRVRSALESRPTVVVVGAGFIGAEVASSARQLGLDVTVVEALSNPLARAVGAEVGAACASLHAAHGTELLCGVGVDRLTGNGHVENVVLADGTEIPAQLVVVGIGVTPNVEWLASAAIETGNGVVCDEFLRAGSERVFAVGDVAEWFNPRYGERMRVEHWTTTVEQAIVVAHNITNPDAPRVCDAIPYFWSDQYGSRIQFVGRSNADEVRTIEVSAETARYLALYRRGDQLIGALAIDGTPILMQLRGLMMAGISLADALERVQPST